MSGKKPAARKIVKKPPAAKTPPPEIIILSDSEGDGTPVRPILCLSVKNAMDVRKFDAIDDCFILDFDPEDQPVADRNLENLSLDADIVLISEKGQVACRDYPHSRHLCAEYPFDKTPQQKYCSRCYCYVCDSAAPCALWEVGTAPHCHAMGQIAAWQVERDRTRQQRRLASKIR